jgi:hypothetical protein
MHLRYALVRFLLGARAGAVEARPVIQGVVRTQVVGNLADFVDRVRRGRCDLVDLLAGLLAIVHRAQREHRPVLDDDQGLAQAVVQLGRDALPFGLLRLDEPPGECLLLRPRPLEPTQTVLVRREQQAAANRERERRKPPSRVERGQYLERQGGDARGVPAAISVSGHHAERVASGRQMRVVGGAPRARVGPVGVEVVEPVAEPHRPRTMLAQSVPRRSS